MSLEKALSDLAQSGETIKTMQADLTEAQQRQCETGLSLERALSDLSQSGEVIKTMQADLTGAQQRHCETGMALEKALSDLSQSGETIKTMQADLTEAQQHQCETGMSLEKALSDLSQMQIEQEQTRKKRDKALTDLESACCTISILEGDSQAKRNDQLEQANSMVMFLGSELAKTEGELDEAKSRLASQVVEIMDNGEGPMAKRHRC